MILVTTVRLPKNFPLVAVATTNLLITFHLKVFLITASTFLKTWTFTWVAFIFFKVRNCFSYLWIYLVNSFILNSILVTLFYSFTSPFLTYFTKTFSN